MTLRLIIGLSPDTIRLIFRFLPTLGLTHTRICQTFDTNKQTIINGQAERCHSSYISIKLLVKCDTLIRLHIKHFIHQTGNWMSHIATPATALVVIPQLTGYS